MKNKDTRILTLQLRHQSCYLISRKNFVKPKADNIQCEKNCIN